MPRSQDALDALGRKYDYAYLLELQFYFLVVPFNRTETVQYWQVLIERSTKPL